MRSLLMVIITTCTFALQSYAQAENYKSFEWDLLRFGYVIPGGESTVGGVALGTEFRYNLKDNISAAFRAEFALFGSQDESVDLGAFGSYALIGDYYFSTTQANRGFAGLGLGTFSGGSATVNGQTVSGDAGSSIGIIGRAGYEMGILRLSGEYNLLLKEGFSNYIGLHVGLSLFGGYKG